MKNFSSLRRNLRSYLLAVLAVAGLGATGCQAQIEPDFPETPFAAPNLGLLHGAPSFTLTSAPAAPEIALPGLLEQAPATEPVRMWTEWQADRALPGIVRSQRAQAARLPIVKDLFAKAGVPFPPAQMAFVSYKQEKQLEVWASAETGGKAKRIATYGICAASGGLGPKRYEGDRQVPEGYYVVQYGWAESAYHLEMKVSYPNMVDKVLGPKNRPLGGEIMIHGDCASIGCMAMGDERDEELWTMMKAMGDARVMVHIYPARDMAALLEDPQYEQHRSFWQNLKEGHDLFEKEQRIITAKADWHGVYMFE